MLDGMALSSKQLHRYLYIEVVYVFSRRMPPKEWMIKN